MNAEQQIEFKNAYIKTIAHEYSVQTNNKILLPFKRIFMVGFN
jgi:trans-aconitate methyltransferase